MKSHPKSAVEPETISASRAVRICLQVLHYPFFGVTFLDQFCLPLSVPHGVWTEVRKLVVSGLPTSLSVGCQEGRLRIAARLRNMILDSLNVELEGVYSSSEDMENALWSLLDDAFDISYDPPVQVLDLVEMLMEEWEGEVERIRIKLDQQEYHYLVQEYYRFLERAEVSVLCPLSPFLRRSSSENNLRSIYSSQRQPPT